VLAGRIGKAFGGGAGGPLVLPALLAVLAVVGYPLAFATYYGFQLVRPGQPGEFVGLDNYRAMAGDPRFAEALWTTLLFTATSVGLSFVAGLGFALLLSGPFRGRGAVAAAVFLPWVFPPVVAATFGRLALFEGVGGPLARVAEALGAPGGEILLLDPRALLGVAVLVDVWRTTPFVALLILAGLRTIPGEVYEAARVDGANAWQRFAGITLPLLRSTLLVVLLIRLLDAARVFDLFRILGNRDLLSLSTYVYHNVMLSQINFGLGNAAAVFVFLLALLVSLFFVFVLRAQAPTGLAHSGLQRDEGGASVHGVSSGSGLPLGIVGVVLAMLFLAPIAWVSYVSVAYAPRGFPGAPEVAGPSLLSYTAVLGFTPLTTGLANSLIIATATAALSLALAGPAAYALARSRIPYSEGLLGVLLAVAFFPPVALLVPLLVQLRGAGLTGTQLGAIVPDTIFFLPFAVWLLAAFFRELPAEVEDAARVDGATRLQVLLRVVLPLAAPGLFATGAFVFVLAWNELVFASSFTLREEVRPVTVILSDLVAQLRTSLPGPLAAASLISALPPALLFLAFRRRILAGLAGDSLGSGASPDRARLTVPAKAGLWAAGLVLLAAQLWAGSVFVRHGLNALAYPFPLNYGEGPLLDQAARLAELRNIYPADVSRPPYVISNYPPLYVLLQAPFVGLFGPELLYGRAISLAATVAASALIALVLHALTGDRIASLAGGLAFLGVPFVLQWSSYGRVDMLGLAFSLAGVLAVVRSGRGGRWSIVLAALLLVAAIYTRQTFALAAPLAAFVWLLAARRRRDALVLAAIVGGTGLALLVALTALTGGGFFFHTVSSNLNEYDWGLTAFYVAQVRGVLPLLLLGGAAFVLVGLRDRPASWWFVVPYLAGGTVTVLLAGKIGSDVNYLLELSAALCLAAGALLARFGARPGWRCVLLLALALQTVLMVQASQASYAAFQQIAISQRSEVERLREVVAASEGPVLADEHMGLVPLEGERIYLQPFEFSQLARDGRWDQRPLVEEIRAGEFDAILIWEPPGLPAVVEERWTGEMLRAVEASYEPAETHAFTTVYRPK